MKSKKLVFICQAAVIAALYVVLTYVFSAFASGVIQVRVSEAYCQPLHRQQFRDLSSDVY